MNIQQPGYHQCRGSKYQQVYKITGQQRHRPCRQIAPGEQGKCRCQMQRITTDPGQCTCLSQSDPDQSHRLQCPGCGCPGCPYRQWNSKCGKSNTKGRESIDQYLLNSAVSHPEQ